MGIIVNTTGPIISLPALLQPKNKTFSDIIAIIQDEIDDTTNEYFSQIQESVFSAIRFCAREPLYFNETRDVTFATQTGQEWYDRETEKNIDTAPAIRFVFLEKNNTGSKQLTFQTPEQLEMANPCAGEPYAYSYFSKKLRLYPTPNDVYTIRLQLEPFRFDENLTADQQTPWFSDAFDLIKARAKYELYKDILKDSDMAGAAFNDFNEQMAALKAETSRRNGCGIIKAMVF